MSSAALLDAPVTPAPRPEPCLRIAPYDHGAALLLEDELGVSHVLAQVLVRRGLADPDRARAFLAADEAHDPFAFAGMEEAVALVGTHVSAGTRITVHGDYDVDGVCATAVLVRALRALGGDVDWLLPSRLEDGYGLTLATVARLAARGTRLLITVDCGIASVQEVDAAQAAGLDVLVTDHHAPRADGVLPDAPYLHPALSGYPCPELCATGVAHQLIAALAGREAADLDLDLVALATVADLVPLRGENRRLVRAGLRALAATDKPGLRALMAVARVDPGELDASAIGFRLAPRLNAAGRLYRADAGLELVLTRDPARASAIAEELDAVNAERRAIETRMTWEAERQAEELGQRFAYVLWSDAWHPGVAGIVASRIAERFHRPAVLVALDGPTGSGSGRSIPGFDLLAALHAAAPELERYGGHRAAAGLTVSRDRLEALRAAVEEHAGEALGADPLMPELRIDAVVSGSALHLRLADELARLEPCGMGNPAPALLVPAATCLDPRPMGEEGRHLRFTLGAAGVSARAVLFGCAGRLPVAAGEPCDVLVRLERREWNGAVEARVNVRHAVAPAPAPITVLGEPADYLEAALAELGTAPDGAPSSPAPGTGRRVVDRRGAGAAAALVDLVATGEPVLAVTADVARRRRGLAARVGGFALCSWAALERDPALAAGYPHLVALDPPAEASRARLLTAGDPGDWAHRAWGPAEVRFAEQIHEQEFGLRASLTALYRTLRPVGDAAGEELEALLRGDGPHPRPPALAGRLVRILEELGLVSLDRASQALVLGSTERTSLERSPAFRVYATRLEDGRRFLTSLTRAPSPPA